MVMIQTSQTAGPVCKSGTAMRKCFATSPEVYLPGKRFTWLMSSIAHETDDRPQGFLCVSFYGILYGTCLPGKGDSYFAGDML